MVVTGSEPALQDNDSGKPPADLKWFSEEVLPAEISVLEGLPHPRWEPYERAYQIETKSTIILGREIYYERPLKVSESDIAALSLAAYNPS